MRVTCVILLASFVLLFDPGMERADSRLYGLVEVGGLVVGGARAARPRAHVLAARDPAGGGPLGL